MRLFEEIDADLMQAIAAKDFKKIQLVAEELQTIGNPVAYARVHHARGVIGMFTSAFAEALEHLHTALALYEQLGEDRYAADMADRLGFVSLEIGDVANAVEYFHRSIAGYTALERTFDVARVTCNLSNAFVAKGEFNTALVYLERGLAMFQEIGEEAEAMRATGNIANVLLNTGDYARALTCMQQVVAYYAQANSPSHLADFTLILGSIYYRMAEFPTALEQYERAHTLYVEIKDVAAVARVMSNIGALYGTIGDTPRSIEYLTRALDLHEQVGNKVGVARALGNIGITYQSIQEYAKALEYYDRALPAHTSVGSKASVERIKCHRAAVLIKLEDYDSAESVLRDLSVSIAEFPDLQSLYAVATASLYEVKGDLHAAQTYFEQALGLSVAKGSREFATQVHERLRELAHKRNDFEAYIRHNTEFSRLFEETRGREATQKMAVMQVERRIEVERREREKERAVLYSTLPKHVADRVVRGESVSGDHFEAAAVLFSDVVGFTSHSALMDAADVVELLEHMFITFDEICEQHGVTKVKTIGDAYMCFKGDERGSDNALALANVALAMMRTPLYWPAPRSDFSETAVIPRNEVTRDLREAVVIPRNEVTRDLREAVVIPSEARDPIQLRIGLHIGPVTAGVIGKQRLQYDVWGDTVNVASRLESTSEPGRIHVSQAFAHAISSEARDVVIPRSEATRDLTPSLKPRGDIELKGKGTMSTYWLESTSNQT